MTKVIRRVKIVESFEKEEKLLKKIEALGYNPNMLWTLPAKDGSEIIYFEDRGRCVCLELSKNGKLTLVSDMAKEDMQFLSQLTEGKDFEGV